MLHDWKYASKRSEFLGFYCYPCHVCYGFLCLWIRNTKISENSDMAKEGVNFDTPSLIKIIINHVAELREVTNDKKEIARSFYGSALYY